ncbi:hypothetical protein ADUPG1_013627 [Aduncisulcus paluster]|uniref:Uncharacterized protein n=1 Tax=Aduncisulcus paluster TaxID=2918883 RepID=A0ABQ5K7L9_9EUKA|nr:hypothetical protein ADUPG1_013627 [Aduncisulcus paluster]
MSEGDIKDLKDALNELQEMKILLEKAQLHAKLGSELFSESDMGMLVKHGKLGIEIDQSIKELDSLIQLPAKVTSISGILDRELLMDSLPELPKTYEEIDELVVLIPTNEAIFPLINSFYRVLQNFPRSILEKFDDTSYLSGFAQMFSIHDSKYAEKGKIFCEPELALDNPTQWWKSEWLPSFQEILSLSIEKDFKERFGDFIDDIQSDDCKNKNETMDIMFDLVHHQLETDLQKVRDYVFPWFSPIPRISSQQGVHIIMKFIKRVLSTLKMIRTDYFHVLDEKVKRSERGSTAFKQDLFVTHMNDVETELVGFKAESFLGPHISMFEKSIREKLYNQVDKMLREYTSESERYKEIKLQPQLMRIFNIQLKTTVDGSYDSTLVVTTLDAILQGVKYAGESTKKVLNGKSLCLQKKLDIVVESGELLLFVHEFIQNIVKIAGEHYQHKTDLLLHMLVDTESSIDKIKKKGDEAEESYVSIASEVDTESSIDKIKKKGDEAEESYVSIASEGRYDIINTLFREKVNNAIFYQMFSDQWLSSFTKTNLKPSDLIFAYINSVNDGLTILEKRLDSITFRSIALLCCRRMVISWCVLVLIHCASYVPSTSTPSSKGGKGLEKRMIPDEDGAPKQWKSGLWLEAKEACAYSWYEYLRSPEFQSQFGYNSSHRSFKEVLDVVEKMVTAFMSGAAIEENVMSKSSFEKGSSRAKNKMEPMNLYDNKLAIRLVEKDVAEMASFLDVIDEKLKHRYSSDFASMKASMQCISSMLKAAAPRDEFEFCAPVFEQPQTLFVILTLLKNPKIDTQLISGFVGGLHEVRIFKSQEYVSIGCLSMPGILSHLLFEDPRSQDFILKREHLISSTSLQQFMSTTDEGRLTKLWRRSESSIGGCIRMCSDLPSPYCRIWCDSVREAIEKIPECVKDISDWGNCLLVCQRALEQPEEEVIDDCLKFIVRLNQSHVFDEETFGMKESLFGLTESLVKLAMKKYDEDRVHKVVAFVEKTKNVWVAEKKDHELITWLNKFHSYLKDKKGKKLELEHLIESLEH